MIEGNAIDTSDIKTSSYVILASSGTRTNSNISNATKGSIAVIDLQGPLMKNDMMCGPAGTATVASWIKEADNNPNIDGIVLKVDSPGGTVDGTEALAATIKATKKPIVGFVDGMAASAGYWAVSQCDEIIAGGKTAIVGSIGVMSSYTDLKPLMEKAGVKFHEIYASLSTEKNKGYREAREGNYDTSIAELDKINEIFHGSIRTSRPGAKDAVYNGAHYLAADAKKMGLIDSIGTMDDAIKAIRKKTQTKTMSKNNNLAKYPALCNALGFTEGFESTEDGAHFNDESLATIEAQLVAGTNSFNQLGAITIERNTAQTALDAANVSVKNITAERDALQTKVSNMEGQRAHNGSAAQQVAGAEASDITDPNVKPKYIPDGTEKTAAKYKMDTSTWGI